MNYGHENTNQWDRCWVSGRVATAKIHAFAMLKKMNSELRGCVFLPFKQKIINVKKEFISFALGKITIFLHSAFEN